MGRLREIGSPHVEEVRGRGLMIGVVIKESSGTARPFCEALQAKAILAKETHHQVIRFRASTYDRSGDARGCARGHRGGLAGLIPPFR